jgi:hypothetical protein
MEIITMIDYNHYNNVMYSYTMHEIQGLARYKLRIDGKFKDETIYSGKEPLTTDQIHYLID